MFPTFEVMQAGLSLEANMEYGSMTEKDDDSSLLDDKDRARRTMSQPFGGPWMTIYLDFSVVKTPARRSTWRIVSHVSHIHEPAWPSPQA
jgi:hypothetical protein